VAGRPSGSPQEALLCLSFLRVRKRRKPNANPFQEGFKKAGLIIYIGGCWWIINPKHPKSSKYLLKFGVLGICWVQIPSQQGPWMSKERDKKQRHMKQNQDIQIEEKFQNQRF